MAVHTGVDPRVLQQIGDDVAQLVDPIPRPPHYTRSWRGATRGRRRAIYLAPLPPLLDALREAADHEQRAIIGSRRGFAGPPAPGNLDAVSALAAIYVQVADWRWRIVPHDVPHDMDWIKVTLRSLVGATPNLAAGIARELGDAVHSWWSTTASHAGLNATELRLLRR